MRLEPSSPTRMIISGATLVDGLGREPVPDSVIVIEEGRIASVGAAKPGHESSETTRIDAQGRFLLPGLIDAHLHVAGGNTWDLERRVETPITLSVVEAVVNLRRTVQAGFTTVRDAGGADRGLQLAVEKGLILGPRLVIAVNMIGQTGGHADGLRPSGDRVDYFVLPGIVGGVCDGKDEVRKRVREMLRAGAGVIKICASGGIGSPQSDPDLPELSVEEIAAAVEEAHKVGKRVMAHAEGARGIRNAVDAGVESVEHGYCLDEPTAEMMADRGVYLVPTLTALSGDRSSVTGTPAYVESRIGGIRERSRQSFKMAMRAGIRIVLGTDASTTRQGQNAQELEAMVSLGMSPLQAIVAATSDAARCLGLEHEIGSIEKGKAADLILVDGNPLSDIRSLQDYGNLLLIVKGGTVFKNVIQEGDGPYRGT